MRTLRMVVDYEDGTIMFKDRPDIWHKLPTTRKGLMMIPLTKEACDRFAVAIPPPPQQSKPTRKKGRKKKEKILAADTWDNCDCCSRAPGLQLGSA